MNNEERIARHQHLHNQLQKQMERAANEKIKALSEKEKDTYTNSLHRTSYEETIEAIVDVYRQEFMKLSIEELESIPAKVIEGHSWAIPYLVQGERDE